MQQPPQNVEISNEGNHVKNQKSEFCAYTSVRKIPTAQDLVAELYKLRERDDSQLSKIKIAGNMCRHTDMQVRAPQETHSNLVKKKTGSHGSIGGICAFRVKAVLLSMAL